MARGGGDRTPDTASLGAGGRRERDRSDRSDRSDRGDRGGGQAERGREERSRSRDPLGSAAGARWVWV